MRHLARTVLILATALPAIVVLAWFLMVARLAPAHAGALPALTATPSPTSTAVSTPAVFTATLDVTPDRQHVLLGETLVVTLSLTVSEGCQYPVYEATLTQSGHNLPAFAYVDPISETVGPGVAMPFSYTLQAIAPGYVTLDAQLYGEQNCGNGWQWTYVSGTSPSIKIGNWPYKLQLPAIAAP